MHAKITGQADTTHQQSSHVSTRVNTGMSYAGSLTQNIIISQTGAHIESIEWQATVCKANSANAGTGL
jgi:hypothetical protein